MRETPFFVNYEYNPEIWRDPQAHRSQSQKAILNITEIKKLHQNLMSRIQAEKKQTAKTKSFDVEDKVYL